MDLNEFTYLLRENNTIFLLGDFNVDLLKYEKHDPTNEFLHWLSSNIFPPYILQPTIIYTQSRTLADNTFFNQDNKEAISGNLTSKLNLYERNRLLNQICMKETGPKLTKIFFYWTILRKTGMAS